MSTQGRSFRKKNRAGWPSTREHKCTLSKTRCGSHLKSRLVLLLAELSLSILGHTLVLRVLMPQTLLVPPLRQKLLVPKQPPLRPVHPSPVHPCTWWALREPRRPVQLHTVQLQELSHTWELPHPAVDLGSWTRPPSCSSGLGTRAQRQSAGPMHSHVLRQRLPDTHHQWLLARHAAQLAPGGRVAHTVGSAGRCAE